jgi:hypothetical protein
LTGRACSRPAENLSFHFLVPQALLTVRALRAHDARFAEARKKP